MSDRRLFALSDPHLSLARPKPMGVFGPAWAGHPGILAEKWRAAVGPGDVVLIPGDLSWAMRMDEAKADLEWLAALPGRKVVIKGNHDYWWQSPRKLKGLGIPGIDFIQNNHVVIDGVAIGGTRLWDFPEIRWSFVPNPDEGDWDAPARGEADRAEDPEKIRARELGRLAASLSGLPSDAALKVAMTHYPPLGENGEPTRITELIGSFGVDICVFGHVHSPTGRVRPGEDIVIGGTRYVLASSDHLGHEPKLLTVFGA